ncbi:MAG: hypothetical protein HC903_22735 [Methylacidiphilales bacterium]|nr:hypothetical protein [Candidatus Methylacidiphilales bacterium]
MTNKLKSPTTLIFIFLLNVSSLSACAALDDVARVGGKYADDAARGVGNNADDAARGIRNNSDDAARGIRNNADDAARPVVSREWVEQKANQYVQQEINLYGGLPENFGTDTQEKITNKIIDDAEKVGIKLKYSSVSLIVGVAMGTAITNQKPVQAIPNRQ